MMLACLAAFGLAGCATSASDQAAHAVALAGRINLDYGAPPAPVHMTSAQEDAIVARALLAHEMRRP